MMPSRNSPTGWVEFRLLRRQPLPQPPPWQHGNIRHGERSKEGTASRRRLRLALWVLRHPHEAALLPDDAFGPQPRGWAEYVRRKPPGRME
jgi:hypothetical protein